MYSSMWFMSIVALLVVDVRTGALQDREIRPSQCHACPRVNGTTCDTAAWPTVPCPADRPLCATVAVSPDFVSSLTCAATSTSPCSLRSPSNNSFEMTCVCNTHLCNAPFSPVFRNELLNFTLSPTSNSTDLAQIFFQSSKFANVTEDSLYKAITIEVTEATTTIARNSSQSTTAIIVPVTMDTHSIMRDSEKLRAEPLKQEPTVPSDDDEDESEGSGTYEESRILNNAVSAPAAPSSFLPANENSASPLFTNFLVTTLFIYLVV